MMGAQDCLSLLMNNGITENQACHGGLPDRCLTEKERQAAENGLQGGQRSLYEK